MPHDFHGHDVRFRVLKVNCGGGRLRGPEDSVFVPNGTTVKPAVRFDGPAGPGTPHMYHCHLLYHQDRRTMGQFAASRRADRRDGPAYTSTARHQRGPCGPPS